MGGRGVVGAGGGKEENENEIKMLGFAERIR